MEEEMIGVIYARYSSDNQQESSIEGQLSECYDFASKKNIKIIGEYIDRAYSGKTDNRPGFKKMIRDASKKSFNCILIYKIDRFARDTAIFAVYKKELSKLGIKVISVKEDIGEGVSGRLIEGFYELLAEHYSLNLAQNVERGMNVQAKKHKFLGGPRPLGYNITKELDYVINEDEAKIIHIIFDKYENNEKIKDIVKWFYDSGIRNVHGNKITHNGIITILTNEKYIGTYKWSSYAKEGVLPQIIEKTQFDNVQKMLATSKRTAPREKTQGVNYILTGKLFCGECGEKMMGDCSKKKNNIYRYYTCYNQKRKEKTSKEKCKSRSIPKEYLESLVINDIKRILFKDSKELQALLKETIKVFKENSESLCELDSIKVSLNEVNKKIENMIIAIENGIITKTTQKRLLELENQKEQLELTLNKKQLAIDEIDENYIRYRLEKLSESNIEAIISMFVVAVYVYNDYVEIIYTFDFNNTNNTSIKIPFDKKSVNSGLINQHFTIEILSELRFISKVRLK